MPSPAGWNEWVNTERPEEPEQPEAAKPPERRPEPPESAGDRPVGRRVLLGTIGLGALGMAAAPILQRGMETVLGAVSGKDPTGLTGLLPNGGGFRYYSVTASVPDKSQADYRLKIDGLVDRPHTYTFADLRTLRQTRLVKDVQCVTGWRVPGTPFEGVRLSDLLDAAGVRDSAKAIRFSCFDGAYTESLTLEQARRPDVLVALRMQDKDISHDHGGPVRLYVAPMYFYKSAKWLSGITVTDHVQPGYWERLGYEVDAWVGRSNGRTDVPTS